MATAEQMDALLEGLSAEDLEMDYDPDEPDEEDVKGDEGAADVDLGFDDDCAPSFFPAAGPSETPFVGFYTGRQAKLPPPSSEAFAKVRKIFDEDPVLAEVASTLPASQLSNKRPRLDSGAESDSTRMPPPRVSGFATGGGRAPPGISPSAQAAAAGILSKAAEGSRPVSAVPRPPPSPARSGFASATGRAPPPISAAAALASHALFRQADTAISGSSTPTHTSGPRAPISVSSARPSGFATATGHTPPPISASAAFASRKLFEQAEAVIPSPRSSGIPTHSGHTPPHIPDLLASEVPFSQESGHSAFDDDAFNAPAPDPGTGNYSLGFQTGRGAVVAAPSDAARAKAMAMFDSPAPAGDEADAHQTPVRQAPPLPFAPPKSTLQAQSGFATGAGRAVAGPSQAARAKVGSIFTDEPAPRTGPPQPSSQAFITPRLATQSRQSATGQSFRTPLRTTTNTPSAMAAPSTPAALTGSPAPRKFKPIELGSSGLLRRRVGLAITPSQLGKTRTGFSTPFKTGVSASPALPRTSMQPATTPAAVAPVVQPVFDLTIPSDRQSYSNAWLKPQYHSISELVDLGIPDEIYLMELRFAKAYRFVADDGSDLGPAEAYTKVKAAGCTYATQAWVTNHWSMILWKLAGTIQAQYEFFERLWRWEEVFNQLLYSLPLVLVVTAIVRPPPEYKEEGDKDDPTPIRPFLELTDGWYRISAQVDDCLARAINKGNIKVGRKLAVTGAKLESSGEGVDPLESLDKTLLSITGNSTQLARWDAKLGRQSEPFVAGLSSLSIDGGVISLMDVVIEKMFPVAYTTADKGNKEAPWGEEEERQRQDAWTEKYSAESTRLQGEMRKQLELIEDMVGALCSAAEGVEGGHGGGYPPDNVDQIFDSLLEAKSIDSRLRTMASSTLLHVAAYGRTYFEREASNGYLEVEAELQVLCPPRQVRDFRIIRFRDARRGEKAPCRVGMLNVWDVKALGEGALEEGKRYMVANLMPGRAGDWRTPQPRPDGSKAEIYFHTRKDTRWQAIDI